MSVFMPRVASAFSRHPLLASPSLDVPEVRESVLAKLQPEDAIEISREVVSALLASDSRISGISDDDFDWIIESIGFGLRVADEDSSDGVFSGALEISYRWVLQIVNSGENERRIRDILVLMSQVFLNESFTQERCDEFVRRMREMFTRKDLKLSEETWRVVVLVLLSGSRDARVSPTDVGQLAITVMMLEHAPEFLQQFHGIVLDLLQRREFAVAWVNMFQKVYHRILMARLHSTRLSDCDMSDCAFQFIRQAIDEGLDINEKQRAFSIAMKSWMTILCAKHSKVAVRGSLPATEITESFGKWLSLEADWRKEDYVWMDEVWHPLFTILKMSEGEVNQGLLEMAKMWVIRVLGEYDSDAYWYLPVYAFDFLFSNTDFLLEQKEKLVDWTVKAFQKGGKELHDAIHSMLLLFMELLRVLDKDDPIRDKIFEIFGSQHPEPLVMGTIVLCLMFANRGDLFWKQINGILKSDTFGASACHFALIAGFAPHIKESVQNEIFIDFDVLEKMNESDESTRRLFYLSLIALSEGSRFFNRHPEIGAKVLEFAASKNDSIEQLRKMLRLSVMSGGQRPVKKFEPSKCLERFATRDFVITVFDRHLVVRHALGATVYEVDELESTALARNDLELPTVPQNEPAKPELPSDLDPDLEATIAGLEAQLSGEGDFYQYTDNQPRPKKHVPPAHALLCDMGFLSAECHTYTKRVTNTMQSAIDQLDIIRAFPEIPVFVLQILGEGVLGTENTPLLTQVLGDLQHEVRGICSFGFQAPSLKNGDISSVLAFAAQTGFLVLVNETHAIINEHCPDLEPYKAVICISPADASTYDLNVIFHDFSLFNTERKPVRSTRVHMAREDLLAAVTLFSFLVTASTLTSSDSQVTGSDCFTHGFCVRSRQISHIFEKSEAGRNVILVECLGAIRFC